MSGSFRLVQRLSHGIERVLQIDELWTITKEAVEAARENPVIRPVGAVAPNTADDHTSPQERHRPCRRLKSA
jgi:hypothetical protein